MTRFAHIADTHLGYKQYNLAERFADFSRAYTRTIDLCIENKVDFVLHSGDLFHHAQPPVAAVRRAAFDLRRLKDAGVPIYIIRGNHDAGLSLSSATGGDTLHLLSDVSYLNYLDNSSNADIIGDQLYAKGVEIFGYGYERKSVINETLENDKKKIKDSPAKLKLVMLHQSCEGFGVPEHVCELNPSLLSQLDADYFAFGHIHKAGRISNDLNAYYAGSSERTSISEAGQKKGFYILDFKNGTLGQEFIELDCLRGMHDISIDFREATPEEVLRKSEARLGGKDFRDAIVSIVLNGTLNEGYKRSQVDLAAVKAHVADALGVVSIRNNLLEKGVAMQEMQAHDITDYLAAYHKEGEISSLALVLFDLLKDDNVDGALKHLEGMLK